MSLFTRNPISPSYKITNNFDVIQLGKKNSPQNFTTDEETLINFATPHDLHISNDDFSNLVDNTTTLTFAK